VAKSEHFEGITKPMPVRTAEDIYGLIIVFLSKRCLMPILTAEDIYGLIISFLSNRCLMALKTDLKCEFP